MSANNESAAAIASPAATNTLGVPLNDSNAGESTSASRAETLIEKSSLEEQKEGQAAGRKSTEASTHISEKTKDKPSTDTNDAVDEKKESSEADPKTTTVAVNPDDDRYLTGYRLFLVFVGLLLSIFLVSLDQTIIATALPVIASKFNSLSALTWVVSAYFLTQTGLMLTYAQWLTITDTKIMYLVAILLFEIGSLFCGVAWNMNFLIFGRAVAGVGASGIFISILTIITRVTRLEDRPLLFGAFGAVFAVSSVAGPLLGGAFTDHLSWRWCFYINLPFGALSILAVIVFLKSQPTMELPGNEGKTTFQKWLNVDWIGTVFCLGMITPLLLALQWGGNTRPWNDKVVIALLCVFGVMLPVFVAWQWRLGKRAIMPLYLYRRRTQIGTSAESFFVMMNLILATYYLPLYYQASRGRTPTQSGIDILPFMLTIILTAAISGAVINFTGRYAPFLRFGPAITAIGAGLLFTIDLNTPNAKLIGYQILFGVGVGAALQNVIIACQADWADKEELIPQATSIVTFFQLMGGILGIAISGTVFANQLSKNIATYAPTLGSATAEAVRNSLAVVATLSAEDQHSVLVAYVKSLNWVFIIAIPTSVVACLCGFLVKDHNVKERGSVGMAIA